MPSEHVERGTIGSFVLVVIVTWHVARLEVYHFAKVHHEEGHPFLGVGHPIVQFSNKWVSTYSPWWNMSHYSLISGEVTQWKSTILNKNATVMADFKKAALQSVGWSSSKAWILISVSLRCFFLVSWRWACNNTYWCRFFCCGSKKIRGATIVPKLHGQPVVPP